MLPFVGVHLFLFFTMPWPIALAAVLLAVALSFPLAHLFEVGGATIWAPALLHFVIQGTVKVVVVSGDGSSAFPLVWMVASALVPWLSLLVPRPSATLSTRLRYRRKAAGCQIFREASRLPARCRSISIPRSRRSRPDQAVDGDVQRSRPAIAERP